MNMPYQRLGKNMPSIGSLAKISIGLIIVAIISSTFVYAETASVDIGGASYDVEYTGNGVTVSGIDADSDFISLVIAVNVSDSPGTLEITFERSFFDSVIEGDDDDFIILADGLETTFSEIETTAQSRTLSIELPAGTEEVEIIGSQFGQSEPAPVEEPEIEVPEETPEIEVPEETPEIEVPEETPTVETPKTECGAGTVLKDGVCVLDERCGPGTVLTDGVCVAEPVSESTTRGLGTQLIIALAGSFIIAGTIGVILAIMSKASKSKN
jgi:hypothetical protein